MHLFKVVLASIIALIASSSAMAQKRLGQLEVEDVNGNTITIESVIDEKKPTFVAFVSDQAPDRRLLDTMTRKMNALSGEIEFNAITICLGWFKKRAQAILQRHDPWPHFTHLFDISGAVQSVTKFHTFPRVIIFDRNRESVYSDLGFSIGEEIEYFEKLQELQQHGTKSVAD